MGVPTNRHPSSPHDLEIGLRTRFGNQPALVLLRRDRWSVAAAARELRVPYRDLYRAVRGVSSPRAEIRNGLGALLERPEGELFTDDALMVAAASTRRRTRNNAHTR